MRTALRISLLTLAFALATATFGWWTVPVLGAVWGWVGARGSRSAGTAALAAALGWMLLLGWDAARGPVGALATKVGGAMGLPGWMLFVVAVLFPALLAGSAALATVRSEG